MSDTIRSSASVPAHYRKKEEETGSPGSPDKDPQTMSAGAFKARQSGLFDRIVRSFRESCLFLGATVAWCLALGLVYLLPGRIVEVCVQGLFRATRLDERLPEDIRIACITVPACLAQYALMLKGIFISFDVNVLEWLWQNNLYDSVPNPPALASVLSLPMFALAFVAISRAIAAIVKVIVMRVS